MEINQKVGSEFAKEFVRAVRIELNAHKGNWNRIPELSGGRLTYGWIVAFAAGGIHMPHLDKITELALYLGMKLQVIEGNHFNKFKP